MSVYVDWWSNGEMDAGVKSERHQPQTPIYFSVQSSSCISLFWSLESKQAPLAKPAVALKWSKPCFIKVKDGWVQERLETLDFQALLVGNTIFRLETIVSLGRHRFVLMD